MNPQSPFEATQSKFVMPAKAEVILLKPLIVLSDKIDSFLCEFSSLCHDLYSFYIDMFYMSLVAHDELIYTFIEETRLFFTLLTMNTWELERHQKFSMDLYINLTQVYIDRKLACSLK